MNDLSFLEYIHGQRILVAPLNWGLGHAARCIPIIRILSKNNAVLIGSDGAALELLVQEFPNMSYVKLPPYGIHYKSKGVLWDMFKQSPKLAYAISKEMSLTEDIVNKFKLSMIISDHRLGCRDERIRSIIIAHQLQLQSDIVLASTIGSKTNKYFINAFNECWIPDYQSNQLRLSGTLSDHKGIKNYRYIGPISRLTPADLDHQYDVCVILSGPEPKRSKIETKLYNLLKDQTLKLCWIRGMPKSNHNTCFGKEDETVTMANATELNKIINRSKLIISRSGYTTVMDMTRLNKPCILIPTPGQTEQEYLATYLTGRQGFRFITEERLAQLVSTVHELISD